MEERMYTWYQTHVSSTWDMACRRRDRVLARVPTASVDAQYLVSSHSRLSIQWLCGGEMTFWCPVRTCQKIPGITEEEAVDILTGCYTGKAKCKHM